MSTQRLAIVTALATHNLMKNGTDVDRHNRGQFESHERPNGTQFHGNVNYLLGGAMLSVMMTVVCFVCYCCHRNLRKRSEAIYRQRWLEAEANMEIYSVTQCYDQNGDLHSHHHQNTVSPSLTPASLSHGPPPSYDAVVAMDQELDECGKCNRRSKELHKYAIDRIDSDDSVTYSVNHQILHVGELSRNGNVYCTGHTETNGFEFIGKCRGCGQELTMQADRNNPHSEETCYCGTNHAVENRTQSTETNTVSDEDIQNQDRPVIDSNRASTSSSNNNHETCDVNGNVRNEPATEDEANGNNAVDLNAINDNGLIRLDMSQIIDRTGLPTYEAAIKLESSGYV